MTLSPYPIQCLNPDCQKQFNIEQIENLHTRRFIGNPDKCCLTLVCDKCGQEFDFSVLREEYQSYDELVSMYKPPEDEFAPSSQEWTDGSDDTAEHSPPDYYEGEEKEGGAPRDYDPGEDYDPLYDIAFSVEAGGVLAPQPNGQEEIVQSSQQPNNESPKDYYALFLEAIKAIDKNLPKNEKFKKISEALDVLLGAPAPEVQICMEELKIEFELAALDIAAFRKDLNQKGKEYIREQKRADIKKLQDRCTIEPKILTSEEKEKALAYLRDPNLIKNISRDIAYAGDLIGEDNNKMMLYLASISRKFDQPISLVIFGKSSSGKSYLANTIEEFIPPEDSLPLSSASARSLEYLGSQLQHKCILIQELEGAEDILPTIRTLQSEGKLNRLVTVEDPDSPNKRKSVAMSFKCPCSVVITTTQENIHDENSTRIFELYADESVTQTENIIDSNSANADLSTAGNKKVKKETIELHRDVQRCLDKVDVSIPFALQLSFPKKTTRHRRDHERFLQLIRVVAFLHQKQKNIVENNGRTYIEADIRDYEIAYNYGINVLKNTLNKISERAKKALIVCCALADEKGQGVTFTTKDIQKKAPQLGYDLKSRPDLYKQLRILTEYEYLEFDQPKRKGTKHYKVCFDYVKDINGHIINIDSPDIKEITTPEQLRQKLSTV